MANALRQPVVEFDEAMNEAAHAFVAAIPDNAASQRVIHNNLKPALKAAIEMWLVESGYAFVKS